MNRSTNVTGRDTYIIVQALAYASEWLKSFGDHRDEPSNRRDMDAILESMNSLFANMMRFQARNNIRMFSSEEEMFACLDEIYAASDKQPEALDGAVEVRS